MGLDPRLLPLHLRSKIASGPMRLPPRPGAAITGEKKSAKLNKTEAEFMEILKREKPNCWIGVQNIALVLGFDTRYYPDFWCYDLGVTAYEVKGFFRDDAKVKIKVAATLFPWIKFVLAFKDKNGWRQEVVRTVPTANQT